MKKRLTCEAHGKKNTAPFIGGGFGGGYIVLVIPAYTESSWLYIPDSWTTQTKTASLSTKAAPRPTACANFDHVIIEFFSKQFFMARWPPAEDENRAERRSNLGARCKVGVSLVRRAR